MLGQDRLNAPMGSFSVLVPIEVPVRTTPAELPRSRPQRRATAPPTHHRRYRGARAADIHRHPGVARSRGAGGSSGSCRGRDFRASTVPCMSPAPVGRERDRATGQARPARPIAPRTLGRDHPDDDLLEARPRGRQDHARGIQLGERLVAVAARRCRACSRARRPARGSGRSPPARPTSAMPSRTARAGERGPRGRRVRPRRSPAASSSCGRRRTASLPVVCSAPQMPRRSSLSWNAIPSAQPNAR